MKKTSIMVLFVTLVIIFLVFLAPYTTGTSTNPCGTCHSGIVYSQYLDILEGNSANQIPSAIEVEETKTVSVVVENSGNPGTYPMLSDVSVTLTSKNGHFSVNSPTYSIGDLPLGTKTATWQITGVSEGFDSLLITASGINKQHVVLTFLFSDSYSPSPSITVGHPSATPSPTSTPTPTNPLSIVLTSPTSGEKWIAGTIHTIKWYTSGGTKPLAITLDYSISSINGPWTTIAAGIADNGSITWKTPNATATVYIRAFVADSGNPTQSALIIRNVEVNKAEVSPLIMIPVALLIITVLVPILLKWKKQKQSRAKSEVYGK